MARLKFYLSTATDSATYKIWDLSSFSYETFSNLKFGIPAKLLEKKCFFSPQQYFLDGTNFYRKIVLHFWSLILFTAV